MFSRKPLTGAVWLVVWTSVSLYYYAKYHTPQDVNVLVNFFFALVLALVVTIVPSQQYPLKLFVIAFCLVLCLSSLQLSYDQRDFTPEFLTFFVLHLSVMSLFIFVGCTGSHSEGNFVARQGGDRIVNVLLFVFISIAFYVVKTKGIRLGGFLEGVKTSGDEFKIAGISGIQGILMVFLLCCFSLLSRFNKFAFIAAVSVFAVLDVKRGEIMRLFVFLFFYMAFAVRVKRDWRVHGAAAGALLIGSVIVLVVGGELRQNLYAPDFSVSRLLNSRVEQIWIDWFYGYAGINISVLQETWEVRDEPLGYFATLLRMVLNSEVSVPEAIPSINGFNAGTVLSTFAGGRQIWPSLDFVAFCAMIAMMIFLTRRVALPSLRAFVSLLIFSFIFGNYLVLPYYAAGYLLAISYLKFRHSRSFSKLRQVDGRASSAYPVQPESAVAF